jgi:hypothetical protein
MPRENFNSETIRRAANDWFWRHVTEQAAASPSLLTRYLTAPTLQPPKENRMKSIDIKIANAQRRIEAERAVQTLNKPPTEGLTDLASTANSNIPARKPENAHMLTLPVPVLDDTVLDRLRIVLHAIEAAERNSMPVPPDWTAERDQLTYWCELDFNQVCNWTLRHAIKEFTRTILPIDRKISSVGYTVENISEVGDGAKLQGRVIDRVVFDTPITVREGDTIHMKNGKPVVTHAEDPKAIIEELAPHPAREFKLGARATIQAAMDCAGRPRIPIDQVCTVAEAFERLKLAMQRDPGYATGWHANLAMAFFDAEQDDKLMSEHEHAQRAAALFMERCFDVDTSEHAKRVTQHAEFSAAVDAVAKAPRNATKPLGLAVFTAEEIRRGDSDAVAWIRDQLAD